MADEFNKEKYGEQIKAAIDKAIRRAPELRAILEELATQGYRVSVGILIGLLIHPESKGSDREFGEETADAQGTEGVHNPRVDEDFWLTNFSSDDIAFLKYLDSEML